MIQLRERIKQKDYRELFGYTISKVIPAFSVLGLLLVIVLLDSYETYGKFAIIFSYSNMIYFFLSGWINQSQIRFLSSYRNEGRTGPYLSVLSTALLIIVAGSIPMNFLLLHILYSDIENHMYWAIALSAGMMLYYYSINIFQSGLMVKKFMRSEIIRSLMYFSLPVILLLIFGKNIHNIVAGVCLAFYLAFLLNYTGIKREFKLRIPSWDRAIIGHHFRYSWPITIWLGFSIMYQFLDRYIIEQYFTLSKVGLYSSYFDLSTRALSLVYYPIVAWMFPRLTEYYNLKRENELYRIYRKSFKIFSLYTLLLVFALVVGYIVMSYFIKAPASVDTRLIIIFIIGGVNWQFAILMQKPFELQKKTILMMILILVIVAVAQTINLLVSVNNSIYYFATVYACSGLLYNVLCLPMVIKFFSKEAKQ